MNKEELVNSINKCISDGCGIEIYFGLKNNELRKGNFLANTQQQIKDLFIREIKAKIIDTDAPVANYSTPEAMGHYIYQYDLDRTEDMHIFNTVNNAEIDIPIFSFQDDGINNIACFLIIIGVADHQVTIYKQLASVNIYKKNTGFFVRNSDNEFAQIEDDFLRIVPGIDLIFIDDNLFILNLKIFEKVFDIHDIIITSAKFQIEKIGQYSLVENIDSLVSELSDITFARKLSKITDTSPVINHIPREQLNIQIIKFTKEHPTFKNVFKYSNDGKKIKLTSKKSKHVFIKLLNDDYLKSGLTNIDYDSLTKAPILK